MNILITGPESSGKSTIARQLAQHYGGVYIPEYARTYLESHGGEYKKKDLIAIAKGQLKMAMQVDSSSINIFDTHMVNLKIWSWRKFSSCDEFIIDNLNTIPFEKILLFYPDIPWNHDPLRESPHDRIDIFNDFLQELNNLYTDISIIKGTGIKRFDRCVDFIDSI